MTKNKYIVDYNRNKTKLITIRLSLEHDQDIINYLNDAKNKSGYIKMLIREDMEKDPVFTRISKAVFR